MNSKKILFLLAGTLIISTLSSALTYLFLNRQQIQKSSWKKALNLTAEQKQKFLQRESELNSVLKEIEVEEAQNKIFLCSYLTAANETPKSLDSATVKMAEIYRKKQAKIAATLASISELLNPEQKKLFSRKLMQEVCLSCRNTTGTNQCLCGLCNVPHP